MSTGEGADDPGPAAPSSDQEQRYEPAPAIGKLLGWVLLFVLAAIVVVLGGVYFT
ncbi:hypothetical protein RCR19_22680 [Streptomyces sp. WAC07094]|uniref:hypothetical protein n=1 Tax=Streptomyces sp. WAC07094 TaxID=3072183 RepID=UPI002EB5FA57|nr:hypothetical protein [Streptomyces sp. WAC07094]